MPDTVHICKSPGSKQKKNTPAAPHDLIGGVRGGATDSGPRLGPEQDQYLSLRLGHKSQCVYLVPDNQMTISIRLVFRSSGPKW